MADELVSILGDGQMALVLADALAERGVAVRMWGPVAADAERLSKSRTSPRLSDFHLPDGVEVTGDDESALHDVATIFSAIPSQFLRSVWTRLAPHVATSVSIVSVTKGIENETLLRPTQV